MSETLKPGDVLDERYAIVRLLGEGGFGQVYLGTQLATGQPVAIKTLIADRLEGDRKSQEQARFAREMKLIGRLRHSHIVPLIDSGVLDAERHYTVLAYIEGEDLAQVLSRGKLGPREAKRIMLQVLDALSCAHDAGVVHRDLKPANIMLATTGKRRNAMVLDFGIAGVVESAQSETFEQLTEMGRFPGTPAYMAPEQLEGAELTPASDLYAWGLVLLEALTGRPAVTAASIPGIIFAQMSESPIELPEAIREHPIGSIIATATAKSWQARYPSAHDAYEALEACDVTSLHIPEPERVTIFDDPTVDPHTVQPELANLETGTLDAPPTRHRRHPPRLRFTRSHPTHPRRASLPPRSRSSRGGTRSTAKDRWVDPGRSRGAHHRHGGRLPHPQTGSRAHL